MSASADSISVSVGAGIRRKRPRSENGCQCRPCPRFCPAKGEMINALQDLHDRRLDLIIQLRESGLTEDEVNHVTAAFDKVLEMQKKYVDATHSYIQQEKSEASEPCSNCGQFKNTDSEDLLDGDAPVKFVCRPTRSRSMYK